MDALDVESTTFRIYLLLVKEAKPLGPRDVMRGADLSSPSVAYRHLRKLEELGLIQKNNYGQYVVNEKQAFKGYVWVGRNLMPRLLFYSFFFLGLCMVGLATALFSLMAGKEVQLELVFLICATGVSAILFMTEGMALLGRFRNRH